MEQDLLQQILAETYIQTEALARLRVLKDLVLLQLFGPSEDRKVEGPSPTLQTGWLATLNKSLFKKFTKDNVYATFDNLERQIKSMKILTVFMPMRLPEEGITKLGQYLRKNFGNNFLAEVKVDPALIAGAALVWNGVYKDYSARAKITGNKAKILEMMRGYLKK